MGVTPAPVPNAAGFLTSEVLEGASGLLRVLGHPVRLRILEAIRHEPLPVHRLVALTGQSQPVVSHHLGLLRGKKVVSNSRVGPEVHYRILDQRIFDLLDCISERAEFNPTASLHDSPGLNRAAS